MTADDVIKNHWNQLQSLAWKFHRTTGISQEDLFSEACYAILHDLPKYDEKKSAMSTFLNRSVTYHLINYVTRQKRYIQLEDEIWESIPDESDILEVFDSYGTVTTLFQRLTPINKDICDWILSNQEELQTLSNSELKRWVREQLAAAGWGVKAIQKMFGEIKETLYSIC